MREKAKNDKRGLIALMTTIVAVGGILWGELNYTKKLKTDFEQKQSQNGDLENSNSVTEDFLSMIEENQETIISSWQKMSPSLHRPGTTDRIEGLKELGANLEGPVPRRNTPNPMLFTYYNFEGTTAEWHRIGPGITGIENNLALIQFARIDIKLPANAKPFQEKATYLDMEGEVVYPNILGESEKK